MSIEFTESEEVRPVGSLANIISKLDLDDVVAHDVVLNKRKSSKNVTKGANNATRTATSTYGTLVLLAHAFLHDRNKTSNYPITSNISKMQ